MEGRRRFLLGGLALISWREVSALTRAGPPRLSARHAYVGNLNDTLLAIDADVPVPIASVSKLIEVIEGTSTSPETSTAAFNFAQAIRKAPITCGEERIE